VVPCLALADTLASLDSSSHLICVLHRARWPARCQSKASFISECPPTLPSRIAIDLLFLCATHVSRRLVMSRFYFSPPHASRRLCSTPPPSPTRASAHAWMRRIQDWMVDGHTISAHHVHVPQFRRRHTTADSCAAPSLPPRDGLVSSEGAADVPPRAPSQSVRPPPPRRGA